MKPLAWMTAGSMAAWLAASAASGGRLDPELFWGMAGPLASAGVTWIVVARTFATAPERLTALMVAGFGVKAVFFGGYVTVALRGAGLRPVPFVASFAGFFIALHVAEALFMRRLFADHARAQDVRTAAPGADAREARESRA